MNSTIHTHKNQPDLSALASKKERFVNEFFQKWGIEQIRPVPTLATKDFELNPWGTADVLVAHHGKRTTMLTAVCVEMKGEKWECALKKAVKLQTFANRTILVMPSQEIEDALKNQEKFNETGMGLWEFSHNSEIIRHIAGQTNRPNHQIAQTQALRILKRAVETRTKKPRYEVKK